MAKAFPDIFQLHNRIVSILLFVPISRHGVSIENSQKAIEL